MQCEKFEERLQTVLDRRMSPASDALLSAHAEECPACRELAACYEQLFDGLGSYGELPDVTPEVDVTRGVLVQLAAEARTEQRADWRRTWQRGLSVAATAAALLLATQIDWRGVFSEHGAQPQMVAVAVVMPANSLPVNQSAEGFGFAAASDEVDDSELAEATSRNLSLLARGLPRLDLTPVVEVANQLSMDSGVWMAAVPYDLEPWAESVTEAVGFMFDATPTVVPASHTPAGANMNKRSL